MKPVGIAGRAIGEGHPTFVIAEAGSNHNGSYDRAKRLIDVAADAGANAVKFQYYKAEHLYSTRTPPFKYLKGQDVHRVIKRAETPRSWIPRLAKYCQRRDVVFLASPFDREAVDLLDPFVPAFKVASFEIVDVDLLRYIAGKGKPIILSTGMATLGEIEDAIAVIRGAGGRDVVLLQCSSVYPSPMDGVNLRGMETMRSAFKLPVGLSDHTLGIHVPVAAVALGASVIEKHFTMSRRLKGPDHSFAVEPTELKQMVAHIRDVELALGTGVKERSRHEDEEMYQKARRSVHAARAIKRGDRIEETMLVVKRPGYGIAPKHKDLVVGRRAKRDIEADEWITWDMV